jgi:hypothetical protein
MADNFIVKRIAFLRRRNVPIICQNENGPCPLLAIVNVMLLLGEITLHEDIGAVDSQWLVSAVAESILARVKMPAEGSADRENADLLVQEALDLLPRLMVGLDVNVGFDDSESFEYNREQSLFDLVNIRLLHAWLPAPGTAAHAALGGLTYNSAIEKALASLTSSSDGGAQSVRSISRLQAMASPHSSLQLHAQLAASSGGSVARHRASSSSGAAATPIPMSPTLRASDIGLKMMRQPQDETGLFAGGSGGSMAASPLPASSPLTATFAHPRAASDIDPLPAAALPILTSTPSAFRISTLESGSSASASASSASASASWEEESKTASNEGSAASSAASTALAHTPAHARPPVSADVAAAASTGLITPSSPVPASTPASGPRGEAGIGSGIGVSTAPPLSPEELARGLVIEQWLTETGTQMTEHGLHMARSKLREHELAILFRGNHFSAVFHRHGSLYSLVTDVGFADLPHVVWELVTDITGDNQYVDAAFVAPHDGVARASGLSGGSGGSGGALGGAHQTTVTRVIMPGMPDPSHDQDFLLAMQLQQMEQQSDGYRSTAPSPAPALAPPSAPSPSLTGVSLPADFGDLDDEERQQLVAALKASSAPAMSAMPASAAPVQPRAPAPAPAPAPVPAPYGRNDRYGQQAANLRQAAIERERRRLATEAQAQGELRGVEGLSDAEIAMRLQQQEMDRQRRAEAEGRGVDDDEGDGHRKKKKGDCAIM